MFLVRSAFWLTVAFMTIHPLNANVGAAATALSNEAIGAGQRIVVAQALSSACAAVSCAAPTLPAAVSRVAALAPSRTEPITPLLPSPSRAPYPRPRPNWLG